MQPFQCNVCHDVQWFNLGSIPTCDLCNCEMVAVSKERCNSCGRELYTEEEDETGLCKVCTG